MKKRLVDISFRFLQKHIKNFQDEYKKKQKNFFGSFSLVEM